MSAPETPPTEAMLDGRYRLGECVGQGGMARVYRGEDVILGRTVAIKMFRPTVDSLTAPERARSETTVLASLNHPSLVTLFDAQLVPGKPEYMVMEFVSGPTLSAVMSKGPLLSHDVAPFAADLAEALHVAHTAGVIHRDIKPSNVLLDPSPLPGGRPRAKLADFGIAWLVDTSRMTMPGTVIGTAAYLAPEQVRGVEPSPPADIYSLGLVLLEALTGAPAFPDAEGAGIALARLSRSPVIPPALGADWVHLLTRMTGMDPAQRPTAAEVAVSTAQIATAHGGPTGPKRVMAATVAAAAIAEAEAEAATAQMDSPTAVLAPGDAEDAVTATTPPHRRRAVLVSIGAAAAAVAVVAGIWASVSTAPEPSVTFGPSAGPVFERAAVPSTPVDTDPADDEGVVTPADSTPAEDQTDEQEKAQKEQEKAAEEERKKAEQEAKKQEQEDKKNENGTKG